MELSRDFHMPTWLRRDEKYIMWYHFIFWIIVTGWLVDVQKDSINFWKTLHPALLFMIMEIAGDLLHCFWRKSNNRPFILFVRAFNLKCGYFQFQYWKFNFVGFFLGSASRSMVSISNWPPLRNCPLPSSYHTQLQDLHDDEKAEAATTFKDKVDCQMSNYQHLYNMPLYLHNWQKVIQVLSEKQSSVLSLSTLWVLFRIKNFLLFQCLLVMYTCNLWTWSVQEKVKLHWVWKWRNTQTLWDFISELCSYSCLGLCWWNGFWENIWELDKYFTKFMVDETYFTDRMSSGHGGKRVYSIYLNLNLVLYTPLRGLWF